MSAVVYNIPAYGSLVKSLAQHILTVSHYDPKTIAQHLVLLPNHRACRMLSHEILQQSGKSSVLLPLMMPLGDLDYEFLSGCDACAKAIPDAIGQYERLGLLLQLVHTHAPLATGSKSYSIALAAKLAMNLAHLIDQMAWEGLDFSQIDNLVPEAFAEHWNITLNFLQIVTHYWPMILEERGVVDPATRKRMILEAYARQWEHCPINRPIIAAGSTGSIPATANLLKVIANLEQGHIVLPGLDQIMPDNQWQLISPTHPQYGMKNLLELIAIARTDVVLIESVTSSAAKARSAVASMALQPNAKFAKQDDLILVDTSVQGLQYFEASSLQEEAVLVAIKMREIEATTLKTVALVTPDLDLVTQVKMQLMRWNLFPDDSSGSQFAETKLGQLFLLLAKLAAHPLDYVTLLAILKNPCIDRSDIASNLELMVLRAMSQSVTIEDVIEKAHEDYKDFLRTFFTLIAWPSNASIGAYITNHYECLLQLLTMKEVPKLEDLSNFVQLLKQNSIDYPVMNILEYSALLPVLIDNVTIRSAKGFHPRLFILGPLEARTQKMDVMILASLNEGSWPTEPEVSPWFNRSMRSQIGLPLPERRIGLSSHDFVQSFSADEVVLTRAQKKSGSPTVPSRWLLKIKTLCQASGYDVFTSPKSLLHHWASHLLYSHTYAPSLPPAPCPPLHARPKKFSVTDIEMWMRDPYALYAKKILNLRALEPIVAEISLREKGILIHRAFELFFQHNHDPFAANSLEVLLSIGRSVFATYANNPLVEGFWWPRFVRIADWFVAQMAVSKRPTAILSEVWGEMNLNTSAGMVRIYAKADRIDCHSDGIEIIDYKTGSVASKRAIILGYACQLPLEGAMVRSGGFDTLQTNVKKLSFWKLTGSDPAGTIISIEHDLDSIIQQSLEGVKVLIETFNNPTVAYLAMTNNKYGLRYNDYTHLARTDEWSRSTAQD